MVQLLQHGTCTPSIMDPKDVACFQRYFSSRNMKFYFQILSKSYFFFSLLFQGQVEKKILNNSCVQEEQLHILYSRSYFLCFTYFLTWF